MADPWSNPEHATPPTLQPQAVPTPVDPWAGASYDPVSPLPFPPVVAPPRPPTRRWLVPVAVATGLLAVVVFATVAFWPRGGAEPGAPLRFQPVVEVGRVTFEGEGAEPAYNAIVADTLFATAEVDDDLEVVAADVHNGEVLWRTTVLGESGVDWAGIVAYESLLVVYSEAILGPGVAVALDPVNGGEELWRRPIHQDDLFYVRDGFVAVNERANGRLVGLNPRDGRQLWEYVYSAGGAPVGSVASISTHVEADFTEPTGTFGWPLYRHATGVVLVTPDRTAVAVDITTGEPIWRRSNVGRPEDHIFAYENWLYVADNADGYRILVYDMTNPQSQPRTVYTVEDVSRRPLVPPQPCGPDRLCLLDRSRGDEETTRLVAVDIGEQPGLAWHKPVPGATELVPVGDVVLVNGDGRPVVAYDQTGAEVLNRAAGYGLRLDAGNVLLLGDEPSSYFANMSLLGYPLAERQLVALDTVREVHGRGCAWRVVTGVGYLSCPTPQGAPIWRISAD